MLSRTVFASDSELRSKPCLEASVPCAFSAVKAQNPIVSSADGPYVAGNGLSFSRRYTPSCAR